MLLTHSEGRLQGLADALAARGLAVAHRPLIETELLPCEAVRADAELLLGAAWLLFTSRTAVRAWAALGLPLDGATPGATAKLGAVGRRTADDLRDLGAQVALEAEPPNAEGLLRTFSAHVAPPAQVGLPCGEEALGTLETGLTRAGFTVGKAVLYRTLTRPLLETDADLVVLASPTAVAALPDALTGARLVALGPSTARAVRERGLDAVESRTPDLTGVVEAVLQAARAPAKLSEAVS